jgi:hypothetical protein
MTRYLVPIGVVSKYKDISKQLPSAFNFVAAKTIRNPIYEFLFLMRSPGFEFPPHLFYSTNKVPGYGLSPYISIWKASVLTKLDDDRAIIDIILF